MPLRAPLTADRAEARFQIGSGRGEDPDVVEILTEDLPGLVDEAEAVGECAIEQLRDGGLNSRTWHALQPKA